MGTISRARLDAVAQTYSTAIRCADTRCNTSLGAALRGHYYEPPLTITADDVGLNASADIAVEFCALRCMRLVDCRYFSFDNETWNCSLYTMDAVVTQIPCADVSADGDSVGTDDAGCSHGEHVGFSDRVASCT